MTSERPMRFQQGKHTQGVPCKTMNNFSFSQRADVTNKLDEFGGICSPTRTRERGHFLFESAARSSIMNASLRRSAQKQKLADCSRSEKAKGEIAVSNTGMGTACEDPCEARSTSMTKP